LNSLEIPPCVYISTLINIDEKNKCRLHTYRLFFNFFQFINSWSQEMHEKRLPTKEAVFRLKDCGLVGGFKPDRWCWLHRLLFKAMNAKSAAKLCCKDTRHRTTLKKSSSSWSLPSSWTLSSGINRADWAIFKIFHYDRIRVICHTDKPWERSFVYPLNDSIKKVFLILKLFIFDQFVFFQETPFLIQYI